MAMIKWNSCKSCGRSKKPMLQLHNDEEGVTGLETAIILIAFVVVACVFAYTILSAGLFSSQQAEQAIHSGLEEAQTTMKLVGNVLAYKSNVSGDECIVKVSFTVSNALKEGRPIDLTPFYTVNGTSGALVAPTTGNDNHVTVITYNDSNVLLDDAAWTVKFSGGYGDSSNNTALETGEKATITVWLHNYGNGTYSNGSGNADPFIDTNSAHLNKGNAFHLQVIPPAGAIIPIERRIPPYLSNITALR